MNRRKIVVARFAALLARRFPLNSQRYLHAIVIMISLKNATIYSKQLTKLSLLNVQNNQHKNRSTSVTPLNFMSSNDRIFFDLIIPKIVSVTQRDFKLIFIQSRCLSGKSSDPIGVNYQQQSNKSINESNSKKRHQIQTYDDQSSINRMLLEKYRVPEPTTTAQKIKEGAKDVYYFGVFAVAVVAAGAMFYYIFQELFSSKSPNSVYSRALKVVTANEEIQMILGTPIKGFGEETRRGRRRHVAHAEYQKDGKVHMRMKFYVKGPSASGVVNLEVKEDENGNFDYRYLFVDIDSYPPKSIILVDNR
uniref:Mitochondrial import inner membrane translocase subunit Tim21 n=1 Tax=Romanomermis culicivorax TaxID=13658 RepID=A0A915IRZ5_ROMCU